MKTLFTLGTKQHVVSALVETLTRAGKEEKQLGAKGWTETGRKSGRI